ncbi:MarR family winged helix-turn-helix transcriptional regulator [Cohnella thermotolerans]|uniref:MarR family winged helix-turn-helix transcriptional regulator n=1 Tax=Cohnella thermotolerans TaxID=329858 RepID=UPI00041390B6|nr:MarR family transcriptional regulator [Cohnella thermotolerans]
MEPNETADERLLRLTHLLVAINRRLRRKSFAFEQGIVTRVQWQLLRQIGQQPDPTVGQLAKRMGVRQSTMTQMLDRLEKAQLIERRPWPRDPRVRTVTITAEGHSLIRQTEAMWTRELAEPFERLSPAERLMLVELLGKLWDGLAEPEER